MRSMYVWRGSAHMERQRQKHLRVEGQRTQGGGGDQDGRSSRKSPRVTVEAQLSPVTTCSCIIARAPTHTSAPNEHTYPHQTRTHARTHTSAQACKTFPPEPTLSPTDPVPRGLLTLCPGAY